MTILKLDINRREYEVACGEGEEEHLLRLSFELDRRVKDLYKVAGTANQATLLMMAGLQLVDELYKATTGGNEAGIALEVETATANIISQVSDHIESVADNLARKAG